MLTKAPRGTRDILPDEMYLWNFVEKEFSDLCRRFGYKEIRIPVFEHTELFQRGVGDTTDIVQKEMYTFQDKGGRSLTLRPEGTAGVVRSYIEHGMSSLPQPVKLFYQISAYRYEKVQAGRYREFHQFGVELLGSKSPSADAEVISMLALYFSRLGIKNLDLNINSIGCPECRSKYNEILKDYLKDRIDGMCDTCRDRYNRNPLRIIDCKEERCQETVKNAPALLDHICDECKEHFEAVLERLSTIGIPFNIDKSIVRGLDYYTKTVFEFVSKNIGSQGTVCGGGRYDRLVEECGGPPTPGIGFALGVERLLLEIKSQGIEIPKPEPPDIYIGSIGNKADLVCEKLAWQLRNKNISCVKDIMDRSIKAQMKYADKIGAKYVLVLGDNEIESNKAELKDMRTGDTKIISLDTLVDRLVKNKCDGSL